MKKFLFVSIIFIVITSFIKYDQIFAQVNGKIVHQKNNLTVIKVWGTHQERGFAYGYLGGAKIMLLYKKYIAPTLGSKLTEAKTMIKNGQNIKIEDKYILEAKAIINGMKSANVNLNGFDYIDLLVANSFLDIQGLSKISSLSNGCSSLMSWGNSTKNSDLDGESVITRHLDWSPAPVLTNNNLILVHIPSEKDEQPWLFVGYFGQMSVLSGCNSNGLAVFQHMMYVKRKKIILGKYEPVWFSLRKTLEQKDYDGSGKNDVNDLKAVLRANNYGYADAYIISSIASAKAKPDSLIALIAEITPDKPYFTYRNNTFEDNMRGDNLYAANYPIKRNNIRRYGNRYNSTADAVSKNSVIDASKSWNILSTYSRLDGRNLQTMQFIPSKGILKLSIWQNNRDAFKNNPLEFNTHGLFKK